MNKRKITSLMGIFCILLLLVSVSSAATPFNPSRPPTREQVLDHFLGATYGQYYWNAGSQEVPFYPKGFPNWKMSIYDVKSILGEPNYLGKAYGIETLEYGKFAIMTKDNKFVGVKSGITSHLVLDRYAGNGSFMWKSDTEINLNPYEKKDNSPLELISSSKVFSTRFATSSSSSSKYGVIAWQINKGEDAGSYVTLKEIAQDLGIVR